MICLPSRHRLTPIAGKRTRKEIGTGRDCRSRNAGSTGLALAGLKRGCSANGWNTADLCRSVACPAICREAVAKSLNAAYLTHRRHQIHDGFPADRGTSHAPTGTAGYRRLWTRHTTAGAVVLEYDLSAIASSADTPPSRASALEKKSGQAGIVDQGMLDQPALHWPD